MRLDNPFATGNTAKIYISNNRVVKLFNDDLPQNEAIYEAKKQKYAYSCGIFVPKILDVTKTELADRYIHLYCEKSGFSRGEILQWAPIIAGARLSENVSSESVERLIKIVDESTLM